MYSYEDFILFAIPSELPRLANSHWLLDGTFKHCNGLSNFLQTYIISLKYESPDNRVFIYPVVMVLMRSKSYSKSIHILRFLQNYKKSRDFIIPNHQTYTLQQHLVISKWRF